MIAPPVSSALGAPAPQVLKAAQDAASKPHGLINLIRLVKSLEAASSDFGWEVEVDAGELNQVKKDAQNVRYARALLEALRSSNEGASTTVGTLSDLDKSLKSTELRYERMLDLARTSPVVYKSQRNAMVDAQEQAPPAVPEGKKEQGILSLSAESLPEQHNAITSEATLRHRNIPNLNEYLSRREKEDRQGADAGLLPVRTKPPAFKQGPSSRDQLLGSAGGTGMGASQLHEELGGQLADMSHRLKLNAMHFANSLEEEKAILEVSQNTLENNLTNTRSSKKTLSAVSKKGRSTTCMTLGIVILVLVLFVWTYMLIRFT